MGLNLSPVSTVPCHPLKLAKLAQAGDHIAVRTVIERPCTPTKFGHIWHHGIMVDDDRVVPMHPKGNISVVELEEFVALSLMAANNELIIKMSGVTSSSEPPKVSIDASAVLQYDGDNDAWKSQTRSIAMWTTQDPYMQSIKYDATKSNCECFATWCRNGRSSPIRSEQAAMSKIKYARIHEEINRILQEDHVSTETTHELIMKCIRDTIHFDPKGPTYGIRDKKKIAQGQKDRNIAIRDIASILRKNIDNDNGHSCIPLHTPSCPSISNSAAQIS
eukprot:gene25400-biopygen19868